MVNLKKKTVNFVKEPFMQEYSKPKPEQRAHNSTYRNPVAYQEEFSAGNLC